MMDFEAFYKRIAGQIESHGFSVIGVQANPPFSYTIGMSEKYGFELVIIGLQHPIAHEIFTIIFEHFDHIPLNIPVKRVANMPVVFKQCGPNLIRDYARQAMNYYQDNFLPVVQMVMPDREGRQIYDPEYDFDHMLPRQPLLFPYLRPARQ
jgi:hypothetical protein